MGILGQNTFLVYADDIVIIDSFRNEVEMRTADLIKGALAMGLRVNQENTKYLVVSRQMNDHAYLQVDGYVFQ